MTKLSKEKFCFSTKTRKQASGSALLRLVFVSFSLLPLSSNAQSMAEEQDRSRAEGDDDQCKIYMATSTIPGAGLGIFTGVERQVGDAVGGDDVLIPMVDVEYHWRAYEEAELSASEEFYDPVGDYIWFGPELSMQGETAHPDEHVSGYAPGIDAAINCNLALINVDKGRPQYGTAGLHRSKDPGAGAFTPYHNCTTHVTNPVPAGGELFKYYGDHWFTTREHRFPMIPLSTDYPIAEEIVGIFYDMLGTEESDVSIELKHDLWDLVANFPLESRTLNAVPKKYEDGLIVGEYGMKAYLQPSATRSIEQLEQEGRCLDNIRSGKSTIKQAGRGAFATRFLPEGSVITGTPLVFLSNSEYLRMHEGDWFDKEDPPDVHSIFHYQIMMNYCWNHDSSSILLCPYGAMVNLINHNKSQANVRVQWAQKGEMNNKNEEILSTSPNDLMYESSPGLFLDFVAARDIRPGEEVFLDYGDAWESAWNDHITGWGKGNNRFSPHYVPAREWNELNANEILRTDNEQDDEPYPSYYTFECLDVIRYMTISSKEAKDMWNTQPKTFECFISDRQKIVYNDEPAKLMYKVKFSSEPEEKEDSEEGFEDEELWETEEQEAEEVWWETDWIAREAIRMRDLAYSTDIFLQASFRHPIGIPDHIFPSAWEGYDSRSFGTYKKDSKSWE